jgi:hypothetical protein
VESAIRQQSHEIRPGVGPGITAWNGRLRFAKGEQPLDPERARVLLDLLALNFHDHFELKPLWSKLDAELKSAEDRDAMWSVARRVVDRQIQILAAASSEVPRRWYERLVSDPPAGVSQFDLFLAYKKDGVNLPQPALLAREIGDLPSRGPDDPEAINQSGNPAYFAAGPGQAVCSVSPNGAYALKVVVTNLDADARTGTVLWQVSGVTGVCDKLAGNPVEEVAWIREEDFTLTPYDLPLTDNTLIDSRQRFGMNLYDIIPYPSEEEPTLHIKLVWFPEGYITERERPMNYFQVNRTLGLR